jgi:hypothetical protein
LLTEQWYFFFEATVKSIPSYEMKRYPMYNMLTIDPYIPPLSVHLLRHVLGIFLRSLWTWCMGEILIQMKKGMKTRPASSFKGYNRYTKQSGNSWRKVKHSIRLNMKNTGLIISSRLETTYDFISPRKD